MRGPGECFHQSAQGIGYGTTLLCTDHCTAVFPSRDAWIAAIRDAAEAAIARITVGGINDKEPAA